MPVQDSTDYLAEHIVAFAGQRRDFTLADITSRAAEGSDINFGLAVVSGTADNQCILPSTAGQRFLGITEYTSAGQVQLDGDHLYAENAEVNIFTLGSIWVVPETAVLEGEQAYYRHTAPGVEVIGAITNTVDDGNCSIIPGGVFETGSNTNGFAVLNLKPILEGVALTETITGTSGAISVDTKVTLFDTTTGSAAYTLADGYENQVKTIVLAVDNGDLVVTPDNLSNGSTITADTAGNSVVLLFAGGTWIITSNNGVVIA